MPPILLPFLSRSLWYTSSQSVSNIFALAGLVLIPAPLLARSIIIWDLIAFAACSALAFCAFASSELPGTRYNLRNLYSLRPSPL